MVCFLSSFFLNGWAFLTEITTAMCARICLKYGPVKIEIRFLSLKAALILHIFWDLEDFSWTDSKWSSFSCNGKDRFASAGNLKFTAPVATVTSLNNFRAAFDKDFVSTTVMKSTVWLLFNNTTNSVKKKKKQNNQNYVKKRKAKKFVRKRKFSMVLSLEVCILYS